MNNKLQETEQDKEFSNIPYKHCLNCGSELKGEYCHTCGQHATDANPTIKGVILEYCYNAFLWDPKFFRTLWLLVRHPGLLTKEFLAGKFVSQEHPIKLNMFLLFVFVTMFFLFSGTEKMNSSLHTITNDERVYPALQLELMMDKPEFVESMTSSPRDTVRLYAPLLLSKKFPEFITNLETIEDTQGESADKWIAVVPHRLIDDNIIVSGEDGFYTFSFKDEAVPEELELVKSVWKHTVELTTRYFPIIVLLTAPFLSFSLRLVQRRNKQTRINRFIFSLHYTAFLELSIIFVYLLHLIASPPVAVLQWIVILASWTYLTMAFRQVYGITSWGKAIIKALYTCLVYLLIILMLFVCILFVAIVIAAIQA